VFNVVVNCEAEFDLLLKVLTKPVQVLVIKWKVTFCAANEKE